MNAILKEKVAEMIMARQTGLLNTNRNIFTLTDISNMLNKLVEEIDLSENLDMPLQVVSNDNNNFSQETKNKFARLFNEYIGDITFNFSNDCIEMNYEESYHGNSVSVNAEVNESAIESQVKDAMSGGEFVDYMIENWNEE
jgi:hypothetical protein